MFEDLPWTVQFDHAAIDAIEQLDKSSSDLQNNVSKTIDAITTNPLKGDPKTGLLKGCRTTHVEHLVIIWELEPEIVNQQNIDNLENIYFHNVVHHDNMKGAVTGQNPMQFVNEFEIACNCTSENIQKTISTIYDCDGVSPNTPQWGTETVTLDGIVENEAIDSLKDILPDHATFTITGHQFKN